MCRHCVSHHIASGQFYFRQIYRIRKRIIIIDFLVHIFFVLFCFVSWNVLVAIKILRHINWLAVWSASKTAATVAVVTAAHRASYVTTIYIYTYTYTPFESTTLNISIWNGEKKALCAVYSSTHIHSDSNRITNMSKQNT